MTDETPKTSGTQTVDVMARLLSLTPRRLQQLAKDGVIPKASRGRYELVPVVQGYVKYLQDIAAGKGDNAHQQAQTALAQERAKKVARENAIAAGELIPKADVVAGVQAMVGHCRARLLAIPAKLAPAIHLSESVPDIQEKITEAIYDALEELSNTRAVATKPEPRKRWRR